ncbi:hypothetical protein ACHMW6_25325 [Pseudoduganella sp. UC29_106]|uniref:hypothetical protein n=1 Tax=Pseudoduganella sp. UC29_106 TaxID=3374553 RepID=UPI00375801B1
MKRLLPTLISVIAMGATLPAFAGPDWQIIEHGRKVKLERMQQAAAASAAAKTPAPPVSKTPDATPSVVPTQDATGN